MLDQAVSGVILRAPVPGHNPRNVLVTWTNKIVLARIPGTGGVRDARRSGHARVPFVGLTFPCAARARTHDQ